MRKLLISAAVLLITCSLHPLLGSEKARERALAQVTVRAPGPGCSLVLDDQQVGKTDDHGVLVLQQVEPGDHYLHVRCPGAEEKTFFISPRFGENVAVDETKAGEAPHTQLNPTPGLADGKIQLAQLVQQAVQLRARGRLDEAVEQLRTALKLDAENSDLHREMGITFLLAKHWRRARVEMLEAIRLDPSDADAYNGLGYALEKLGNLEEAVKQYRKATQLDPQDATYRTHYFDILSKLAQEKTRNK